MFISACGNSTNQDKDEVKDNRITSEKSTFDSESKYSRNDNDLEKDNEEPKDKSDLSNNKDAPSDEEPNQNKYINNESSDSIENPLSEYSAEEIEFARVWLQLGATEDIDELNVRHIFAGEPLNPDDETSIDYPEDVVQLTGSRLVEGSITYSGNGDGTINVYYKIPQRWDGKNPAGEDTYLKIIEATQLESIDPGDDKNVEKLIKKININS